VAVTDYLRYCVRQQGPGAQIVVVDKHTHAHKL